jgi:hypothetical protein
MPISDTHPKIQEMHDRMIMEMTGEQRIRSTLEMCELTRALAKAGVRRRHPEWSAEQVEREFIRLLFLPADLPPEF